MGPKCLFSAHLGPILYLYPNFCLAYYEIWDLNLCFGKKSPNFKPSVVAQLGISIKLGPKCLFSAHLGPKLHSLP